MLRQFTLNPDEERRIQVEGKYLIVTQASGPVELSIGGTTPITVDAKDRIYLRSESPNDRAVRIKNISGGVNFLEIHTSDLLVDKRTGVDIKNQIEIAEDQRIGIDPRANIIQAIIQNPLKIDSKQNVVKIKDKITVKLDTDSPSIVVGKPKRRFQMIATIKIKDRVVYPVEKKELREQLIVTADRHNDDPIWISDEPEKGVPLWPGERIVLNTEQRLTIVGKPGDKAFLGEIVYNG